MDLTKWYLDTKWREKFLKPVTERRSEFTLEQQKIIDIYLAEFKLEEKYTYWEYKNDAKYHPLLLHWNTIMPKKLISSISEYFSDDEKLILKLLLGETNFKLFLHIVDKVFSYPYQIHNYRRSIRSHKWLLYVDYVSKVFEDFLLYSNTSLTVVQALKLKRKDINEDDFEPEDYRFITWSMNKHYILAAEIDAGNTEVIDFLEDAILGDNNVNALSYEMINGIVKSDNARLHKLLGDLLLAAHLQEGLRQAITENMDQGTPTAFITLLKVIEEHNLIRFSSVKRAIATWTGLAEEYDADKITQKEIASFSTYLIDETVRRQALTSENPVEIYLGLWAYAFYEVEDTKPFIENIMQNGKKHQKLVAAYFLNITDDKEMMFALRFKIINTLQFTDNDYRLIAALFHYTINNKRDEYFLGNYQAKELKNYYYNLKKLAKNIKRERLYYPCIFPWHQEKLTPTVIVLEMAELVAYLDDTVLDDDFCEELFRLGVYERDRYLAWIYANPQTEKQRNLLINALINRSESMRSTAYELLIKLNITPQECITIAGFLKYKTGYLRQNVIKLLLRQSDDNLNKTIQLLLSSNDTNMRLGGLDILLQLKEDSERKTLFTQTKSYTNLLHAPNQNELILLEQLEPSEYAVSTAKTVNLYDKTAISKLPLPKLDPNVNFSTIYPLTQDELLKIYDDLDKFYTEHANLTYTDRYGEEILLDNDFRLILDDILDHADSVLERYPYPELWQQFYRENIKNEQVLYQLYLFINLNESRAKNDFGNELNRIFTDNKQLAARNKVARRAINRYKRMEHLNRIIYNLFQYYVSPSYRFKTALFFAMRHLIGFDFKKVVAKDAYRKYYLFEKDSNCYSNNSVIEFIKLPLIGDYCSEKDFIAAFSILYNLHEKYHYFFHIPIFNFVRAAKLKLIEENDVYLEVFENNSEMNSWDDKLWELSQFEDKKAVAHDVRKLDGTNDIDDDLVVYGSNLLKKITEEIVSVELKRGDLPTKYTKLIGRLKYLYGIKYFVAILVALGNEKLKNFSYFWGDGTKRDILSYLLGICKPAQRDTAEKLKVYLKDKDISESRLVEAVMVAPAWMPLVDKILKWKGFISGCYYFLAHMRYADKKLESTFAKYTPISVEDLRDGAFDLDWFKECYKALGKERFAVLYDASKYISEGNSHTRARKYADAVNGVFSAEEIKQQIIDKRNKDLLMAYGLIPLSKSGKITKGAQQEMLNRYKYIQQFLKESKQFGAQRRSSEALAVKIALNNLARNAKFSDSLRFTLNMETRLIANQNHLFMPTDIEGTTLYLKIDDFGKTSIICEKKGKLLKSVPAKLKKNAHYLALKEAKGEFTDQCRRTRIMLEQSMENSTIFLAEEITALCTNPIIAPLLKNLVFIHEKSTGYFSDNTLINPMNETVVLSDNTPLRIAHPVDLYKLNVWHQYQKDLFDRQIKQPFKQIFRELYLKTAEELSQFESRRYDGNQIQPRKTYALLKTRNWIADYYEGLQKVYYQENIIATIYAMADWFSPADIEAPTLEYVAFYDRKTFKSLAIKDIPEIIFSEVMRDVDLAVSVAHVGGVDPEASHSTVEMRRAIVEFTLPLFKLTNVTFEKNFAFIQGKLADYNIHLGSGVIHQAAGAQIAVLPVHSQHRGRLFLPFVDDDPKTAEVITKILFFAEDFKIKDPFILKQIKVVK